MLNWELSARVGAGHIAWTAEDQMSVLNWHATMATVSVNLDGAHA